MNTVYCWFDWDDNTTTVNSINIIKEPRKPWMEYEKGEKVLAKLPQFGLWHGVIVEISESKKDLVQKMTDRQKTAAAAAATALESNDDVKEDDKDSESDVQKKTTKQKVTAMTKTKNDDEKEPTNGKDKDDKSNGKKKEKVIIKKRTSEDISNKEEERKKKKTDEAMKLDAKNRQLEDMIRERRKNEEKTQEDSRYSDINILPPHSDTEEQTEQNRYGGIVNQQTLPYWSGNQFSSPFSAFERYSGPYSYVGDLMSPSAPGSSSATFHSMSSQKELQERCARLELENDQLRKENEQLRMQLEQRSQDSQVEDVNVTPRKVEFLRQIVSSFEKKTQTASYQPAVKQKVYTPTPVRLTYGAEDSTPPSASKTMESDQVDVEVSALQGSSHWEECVTNCGMKKVRLYPECEVYLTQGQLSQVKHVGNNPRKMTIALLDALFSREQLARSSAKGSKKAHNATTTTLPLPNTAVQAVKEFVLNSFRKESGEPCLSDAVFNDIINSKCATARRSLKR